MHRGAQHVLKLLSHYMANEPKKLYEYQQCSLKFDTVIHLTLHKVECFEEQGKSEGFDSCNWPSELVRPV